MHRYRAYGLTIASEIALPELVPADFDASAVTIRRRRIDRALPRAAAVTFDLGPRAAYLAWYEVGAFLVEDGKAIVADLAPGTPEDLARLPLLGAVLAVLLHQRGFLVLHGSAVAIADRAVIFVGNKGAGKSTMAAALFARGHPLIADDVVAVDCAGAGDPKLVPGYPQLKLSEAAAGAVLSEPADGLPRIYQGSDKRCRRVGADDFMSGAVAPGRIYTLRRGGACSIMALAPQDAMLSLLQHSYVARFGNGLLHGAAAGSHLRQCLALASHAPVRRLEVPGTLQDLDRAARLIEEDLRQGTPAAAAETETFAPGSERRRAREA